MAAECSLSHHPVKRLVVRFVVSEASGPTRGEYPDVETEPGVSVEVRRKQGPDLGGESQR